MVSAMNEQIITEQPAWFDLLPNADDQAFYREHGWWKSPVILDQETLAELRTAQDDFYDNGRQIEVANIPEGWQRGVHRDDALRKNDCSSLTNPVFMKKLIQHPYIGAAAAALLGVDVIRLWHDQLLYKPGRSSMPEGEATPVVGWHTDQSYWKSCTGPMITAWVPFTDCPADIGPIAMVNRSHTWPIANRDKSDFFGQNLSEQLAAMDSGGDQVEVETMVMEAGQMSFHGWQTIHGSSPNLTMDPRRSMAIHLQSGNNAWQEFISKTSGKVVRHDLDKMVRQDDNGHPDYSDPAICPQLYPLTNS